MIEDNKPNHSFSETFSFSDYTPIDFYKEARDSFLISKYKDVSTLTIRSFLLSFRINSTSKNATLIYTILDTLPESVYQIDKNEITLKLTSENDLLTNVHTIADILEIVKTWKSTTLIINEQPIGLTTEFGYLTNYLFEKNHLKQTNLRSSIQEIRKRYSSRKRQSTTPAKEEPLIVISREDVVASLDAVIAKYVDMFCHNKDVKYFDVSHHDRVIIIEDSLVVDFRIVPKHWRRAEDVYIKDWDCPYIYIQELTHNDLYRFNYAGFRRQFSFQHMWIDFYPFQGLHCCYKEADNFDNIDKKLPELKLLKRIHDYPGESYSIILLRMEDVSGNIHYGVADTKNKVHTFILKLCKELEETASQSLSLSSASCLSKYGNWEFINAFLSWKGKRKRWRLENKFSYYYEEKLIKSYDDLYKYHKEILQSAQNHEYDNVEFGMYSKPLNKWKSEELVYNITKKLYKDYQVIYQYKPFYLNTEKGAMSYDIYICGLKLAIEYQGKQHFEPVDYFGGVDSFKRQQQRDALKAQRSKENGIKLVYINYWEDITPILIKKRIEDALQLN